MRLNYKILWIENETEWLESAIEFPKEVVEDAGFEFVYERISREQEIDELLSQPEPLKDFDLILVDFNLDSGDRGNVIINKIRDHDIYTDVIFYSQDIEGIRNVLKAEWIDGVYHTSRNRGDFEDKFEKVFLSTIKKIQHISAIRGLVLSSTSELDNVIDDITEAFCDKNKDEGKDLIKYLVKKIKDSAKGNNNKAGGLNYDTLSIVELNKLRIYDADKRKLAIGKILEFLGDEKLGTKEKFNTSYKEEVLDVRNELAHSKEIEVEGKPVLRTNNGGKNFDEASCVEIRKNLKKHLKNLNEVKVYLNN
ncbi:hypothetical protein [uncultured Tenacibaculum sp.]|uniref:hypothetical protein n=1 Tax=uncultured Tenacibaculum sp. TaxID=174713 RepID=UPI00261CB7CB|nr:hypothetical protein [uncultured Tenacibaculum sp.]